MTNIKKLLLTISLILTLVIMGCSSNKNDSQADIGSDKRVTDAIETVSEFWNNYYDKNEFENKYLKIINTRIVNIKNNFPDEVIRGDLIEDIDYIVEFELLSCYPYGATPYYINTGTDNCVVVYKDGTVNVQKNPLFLYSAMTFSTDFSPIIESIEDFDSQYDQIIEFE
ncbi:MAG: hypothetical protein J1F63_07175 [Oscillospiraceae bacterium]|nr:hypothetical protein [Oscillospiraceae bacterium]